MANPLQLDSIKRAAVERNTEIIRPVMEHVPATDEEELPAAVAAALTAVAEHLRARGADLVERKKQGHKGINEKLTYAASELAGIAQSLLSDGVDDALFAFDDVSLAFAGCKETFEGDADKPCTLYLGHEGPHRHGRQEWKTEPDRPGDAGVGLAAQPSTNLGASFLAAMQPGYHEALATAHGETITDWHGPDHGEPRPIPVPTPRPQPEPQPAPKDAYEEFGDLLLPQGFSPTGSGAFVCGFGHSHPDVHEAERYGCVDDAAALLTETAGPTLAECACSPDAPAYCGALDCKGGPLTLDMPTMTGEEMAASLGPQCVCPRGERGYCALLNCQGGADLELLPYEVPLDEVQAIDLDAVNAARLAINTLVPESDRLPEDVVPNDRCGAMPWQGPAAHGPCVVASGHIGRGIAKHVSAGGKDTWSDPPADWMPTETEVAEEITKATGHNPFGDAMMHEVVALRPGETLSALASGEPIEITRNDDRSITVQPVTPAMPPMPGLARPAAPSAGQPEVAVRPFFLPYPIPMPAAMSWSRIEELGACGLKARLKRDPVERVAEVPGWSLVGGSAVDAVVNEICRGVKSGYDPAVAFRAEFALEIGRREAANPLYPVATWKAANKGTEGEAWWKENGARMCQDFYARYQRRVAEGWTVVGVQIDLTGSIVAGRPFVGYVDILWSHLATKVVEIEDVKSGSTQANVMQVRAYAVALATLPQYAPLLANSTVKLATYDARKAEQKPLGDGTPERWAPVVVFMTADAWRRYEQQQWSPNTSGGFGGCNACSVKAACPVGSAGATS